MADQAAADSVTPYKEILSMAQTSKAGGILGSMYAIDTTPERRSVTKITGEPGSYKTERVTDFNEVAAVADEIRQYSAKLAGVKTEGSPADLADLDDGPGLQQYLINAWQSLAMYFSMCDDEDRTDAVAAMNAISAMITDDESDDAAGNSFSCPQCKRNFSTQQGLINHLKQVHASREKQNKMTTETD